MKRLIKNLSWIVICFVIIWTADLSASNSNKPNTFPRVVTITQEGLQNRSNAELVEATFSRLDQAASFRPDIACLPETFTRGAAETIPGPTTKRLSAWAKKNNSYVICPIKVRDNEMDYNSAILIDRDGKIAGRYDKIRPTENELAESVCPGILDPPIFKTNFGTIGIQICFDVNWHDQWRSLKENGVDLIFFPSAYPAERQIRSLAWLNQTYIVSSTMTGTSSIYDISGDILSKTGKYQSWAGTVLPLGKRIFEIDFHVKKMREIEKKYGPKVQLNWYHSDNLCSLASLDPDLSVEDLMEEFDLTPHRDYIQRAQIAQNGKRMDSTSD